MKRFTDKAELLRADIEALKWVLANVFLKDEDHLKIRTRTTALTKEADGLGGS